MQAGTTTDTDPGDAGTTTADPGTTDDPGTSASSPRLTTRPRTPALTRARARAHLLGLLPVPGLGSASLGDAPGFVIGLVSTVAVSWAAVYTTGRLARTPDAFWAPSLLIPYGVNLIVNQVSAAVSWRRLHGSVEATTERRRPRPRVVAGIAPVFTPDGRAGGVVMFSGGF